LAHKLFVIKTSLASFLTTCMHQIIKMDKPKELLGYEKIEKFAPEKLKKLQHHYKEILKLIGEDTDREGLHKT